VFLGICDGHDSGAALVDREGRTVFAVSEERITRRKRQSGFPTSAVRACLGETTQIERVAVAERAGRLPFRALDPLYRSLGSDAGPHGVVPGALSAYSTFVSRRFSASETALSRSVLRRRLTTLGVEAPLLLVDHHRCHARTAAAGRSETLVVTLDAFGDGLSGTIHRGEEDGCLTLMKSFSAPLGPARLFAQTTQFLGFREGEEGKVVARAALGQSELLASHFERALAWDGDRFTSELSSRQFRAGLAGHRPVDVAASLQERTERVVAAFLESAMKRFGGQRLCLAGGLFANVSINRVALEAARSAGYSEVFVFPAMSDAGLCVGAAMEALVRSGGRPLALCDPRVGPAPGPLTQGGGAIRVVHTHRDQTGAMDSGTKRVLREALEDGQVVASCRGPLEFGPRALGARSLLVLASDPGIAERLNQALGRDSAMPFGPIITADRASDLLVGWGSHSKELTACMTVALPASDRLQALAPAAVHLDGTARAQVIERAFDPDLFDLLKDLGEQVCINTSLNLHGEPIVITTDQAARSAKAAGAALLWLD
jgi:carbamoyltransferase